MDFNSQIAVKKRMIFAYKDLIIALVISADISLYYELWSSLATIGQMEDIISLFFRVSGNDILVFLCSFALTCMVIRVARRRGTQISDFVYKWRYLFGAAAVLILVIFNVNGSSVHNWGNIIPAEGNGLMLGKERAIRSDEWVVNTPMAFSQAVSGFQYYSPVIGAGADAFIVYGQPVWDIGVIFRPFQWGYLLLGAERGLSFFWNARLICLILISFEMGMLILKGKRGLSLMFALMVAFSPFVQWWFAINGLVEMLVSGFSAVLLLDKYLKCKSYGKRALYGALIAWLGCVYVLTFYPAWMVPIAYIMLALVIWVLIQNRRTGMLGGRDALILLEVIELMAVGLGYVFLKSKDTVHAVMNTVYPGKRVGSAPLSWTSLFIYPNGIFSTLKQGFVNSNECELAHVVSFFPLGIVLFAMNAIKRRKADALSLLLLAITIWLGIFCFVGMPDALMTISLFRFSTAGRTLPVFMLVQLILLFREISLAEAEHTVGMNYSVPAGMAITAMVIYGAHCALKEYYTLEMMLILGMLLFSVSIVAFGMEKYPGLKKVLAACIASVVLIGGVLVNPVQIGAAEMTDNQLTKLVEPIVEKNPEGIWIVEEPYPLINAIIPAGARTVNCTNVYPNLERWHMLDADGSYEDIYNRYAHISISIIPEETRFEYGMTPDQFGLLLNPKDIEKLNVNYVLTRNELEAMNTEGVHFARVSEAGTFRVYRVEYI